MKYLYSWLKELYPALPPLKETEALLIQLGHDVEAITPITYPGVIVAEITAIEKHPQADRLSLAEISTGNTTARVVCGAPNIAVGQKVPYATLGTVLPSGMTIKEVTIRGVPSSGMLCAEDELGLGSNHAGLHILPLEAKLGQEITPWTPEDAVITLDITSDRGDVLSHFGLARDLKAAHEQTVLQPEFKIPEYHEETSQEVTISAIHSDVQAFSLGLVELGSENETPLYMRSRLNHLGQRSINLATDLTNYLLAEYGQPLHAYDADTLPEPKEFGVRRAHEGEIFNGLTGQKYTLTPQALVISVADKAVALAGVLGGEETKVTSKTTRVILESAHFYPKPVRLMARGLNCLTDSALHWERGVDPQLRTAVLAHAQALLGQLSGGTAAAPLEVITNEAPTSPSAEVDVTALNTFVGTPFTIDQIQKLLTGLGCRLESHSETTLHVTPPRWRYDLAIPEDYYEEVVRLVGLHSLEKKSLSASVPQWKRSKYWRQEHLKDILVALGGFEIQTYPFVTKEEIVRFGGKIDQAVQLRQSAIEGKDFMRTSLVPSTLQALATNPDVPHLVMFEMAKVYFKGREVDHLVIGMASNDSSDNDDWWKNLFERLRLPVASWMSRVQTIDDATRETYKLRKNTVSVFEIAFEDIPLNKHYEILPVAIPDLEAIQYQPVSKFQISRRDIAFIVSQEYDPDTITTDLRQLNPLIVAVELFDTYTDPKLGEDKTSLAYHIFYQAPDRTLTTEEINQVHSEVENYIKEHIHGQIR